LKKGDWSLGWVF